MTRRNHDFIDAPGFWVILALLVGAACVIVITTNPPLVVSLALGVVASSAARLIWMAVGV